MAAEAINKLQPNRTIHLRGFDRRGASAAICEATTTGFKAYGVFRDQSDFAVVMLWDADNFFEHFTMKYLPDFDFTNMKLKFDLNYDGIQPIDSPKYNWIDWATLDCVKADGSTAQVKLWDYATLKSGSFSVASGVFDFEDNGVQAFDRVTLWLNNIAFDYISPGKTNTEFQFFAAGAGTVHTVTIAGTAYNYTELAGDNSAAVANGLIAAVNAGAGDTNATASVGTVTHAVKLTRKLDTGASVAVSGSGGAGSDTIYHVKASTAAKSLRDQMNTANWPSLGPSIAVMGSVSSDALTVKAARYGTVNTSGTAVSWVSGEKFTGIAAGSPFYIDGTAYTVSTLNSPTSITLTTSAGTLTGKKYLGERGGYDGNMVALYSIWKNNNLKTTQSSVKLSGGSSAVTWEVEIDFTARGIDSLRQCWLTLAPKLADSTDYADTEWTATFSNWSVTDPSSKRPLKVASPGSTWVGNRDAWAAYSGSGWAEEAGFYWRGYARRSKTTNDKVTIKYSCQYTHDLYVGTSLYTDRGIAGIKLNGDTETDLDCYLSAEPAVVTRRKVRSSVSAGEHTVEIRIKGTKHASSTDYYVYFDHLCAARTGDVPDPVATYSNVSPAIDYDTDHTYKLTPARLVWNLDRLGFHGTVNEYLGVFWWNQRKRAGGVFKTWTITFGGTWVDGDAAFVTIGGFTMGKSVFPADTVSTIAAHFKYFINATLVGVWAETTATAGELKIHVRTPIWSDTKSTSKTSAAGTISESGDLSAGTEGTWEIDTAAANPINWPTRKWHADLFSEINTKGWGAVVALSMELVNPPEDPASGKVYAARFYDGSQVQTATGFGSLVSTHCSFVSDVADLQKAAYKELANLMNAAGLTPWLQFGEFLWWFFSSLSLTPSAVSNTTPIEIYFTAPHGLSTGDVLVNAGYRGCTAANGTWAVTYVNANQVALNGSVGNGVWTSSSGTTRTGSMGFYDDDTKAAALANFGRALAKFTCQDQDPDSVNSGADANWLRGRIKAHIDTIRTHVLATYSGAKFELLFPYDVNYASCYHTLDFPYPQGGRLNRRVNLPTEYETKSGSGLDRMKMEALSWGSFYRNRDKAVESIKFPTTAPLTWPKADTAYLVPNFNGGCAWESEYLEAVKAGSPLVNFWAFDHVCLLSWPLPLPNPARESNIL